MSWLMSMNHDPNDNEALGGPDGVVLKFCELPEHIQECFKALWRKGIVIEVFGVVSRKWQSISQCDLLMEGNKYYRLQGAANYAVLKPIGAKQPKAVHISDPTTLPETTLVYQATKDGRQQAVTINPY